MTDYDTLIKKLRDALRHKRASDFRALLKELLDLPVGVPRKLAGATTHLKPDGETLKLAAFHYVSPSIGRWFRILLTPDSPLQGLSVTPLELAQHEAMYDRVPRDLNTPVSEAGSKAYWLAFGQDTVEAVEPGPMVVLDTSQHQELQRLFTSFSFSDFYELVLGIKKTSENNDARASVTALTGALANLPGEWSSIPEEEQPAVRWRAFLFSFFLAIRLKSAVSVSVVPLVEDECIALDNDKGEASCPDVPTGVYVAASVSRPNAAALRAVREELLPIMRLLRHLEFRALESDRSQSIVVLENTVRHCTVLTPEVQKDVNRYGKELEKQPWHKSEQERTHGNEHEPEDKDVSDVLEMTGADPRMLDLLRRLEQTVFATDGDLPSKGQSVLLYSEPGCGKEGLATLCHLLSSRCYSSGKQKFKDAMQARLNAWRKSKRQDGAPGTGKPEEQLTTRQMEMINFSSTSFDATKVLDSHPTLGYEVLNAGLLTSGNFDEVVFGSTNRFGLLASTDALIGTAFFDEINTLEPSLANRLLRVLAKPYTIVLKGVRDGDYETKPINVQIIFGSNASPDELVSLGFNPAVVSRIAAHPFRIPPLRERRVDTAIFVNAYLLNKQGASGGPLRHLRRLSLEGLRVICELPWPNNYRGVQSLLDDILEERRMRRLEDPELSFEEIIQALARREAMGAPARAGGRRRLTVDL